VSEPLKKLLVELSIPLLLLVALNGAFERWGASRPSFPPPDILRGSIQTGKYLAFLRAVRGGERVDVVYTGMSPMMAIDAELIDASGTEYGNAFRGFNFSAPMQGPLFATLLLERIVEPVTAPTLVSTV
jgi:hypothetical protein